MSDHDPADLWADYYDAFEYFSRDAVREGCHPRQYCRDGARRSVVLVHGLTDSPFFMKALARHFHGHLGYNVYLPLLQGHGLKSPAGMEDVTLGEWKNNVDFAIQTACRQTADVSVGGLSTGGTLSFHVAHSDARISGDLFLFSAALDLGGGPGGIFGNLAERLARSFLADVLDSNAPLIGPNPYRYSRVDLDGVRELSHLIAETDRQIEALSDSQLGPLRTFAAHSEADGTADIGGIHAVRSKVPQSRFSEHFIPKSARVAHASLVLDEPVTGSDGVQLEAANPHFADMLQALSDFVQAR